MAKAIRFYETGGPDVLRYEDIDVGEPGPGQVRLRHEAVGLNFADIYFRTGLYPAPLPSGIGTEAAGVVEAVGPDVTHVSVGDRVTYTGAYNTLGAYCTERLIPAAPLIRLPDGIACETAAAHDDARPHVRLPDAPHLRLQGGRHDPAARRRGRRRADRDAMGETARTDRDRHGIQPSQGRSRARTRLRLHHQLQP